jgi:uncharacterized protein YkwD
MRRPAPSASSEVTFPVSMSAAARFRYTLVAGATAVVIGAGFTVAGLSRHAEAVATVPRAAEEALVVATGSPSPNLTDPPAASSPSASASASASAKPSASPTPRKKKTTTPTRKATTTPAKNPAQSNGSVLDQVVAHINAARAAAGLSALTLDTKLSKASAIHNQLMINGCGLEHQCSGESGIGDRFSAQGVQWTSAGENIGFGSSGASDADIIKAANGLTDSMLAEKPPNDGHRKNLLNTGYKRIGLSVTRDSKGITWMTQDFVN